MSPSFIVEIITVQQRVKNSVTINLHQIVEIFLIVSHETERSVVFATFTSKLFVQRVFVHVIERVLDWELFTAAVQ
jgi:hypothetical protein